MIKSDLTHQIASVNPHLYQQDANNIVNVVLSEIINALKDGRRVELRGFGAFTTKARTTHSGRNPRTGAPVEVAAKRTPAFRMSKQLRHRLNKPEN
jgi:integration host factor subunit beta